MKTLLQSLVVADSTAPLSHFAKNGFYRVGNKAFNYKVTALQEATRTNAEVEWIFNDAAFSNFDWTVSNNLPLSEMYRLRAMQLRDQYSYLMLGWSGGADSTTILETFLDNNIRIDEVVVLWPVSFSQGKYTPNRSISATNLASEWDFVVKPKIEWLKTQYPNLKITVRDMEIDPSQDEYKEDSVLLVEKHNYINLERNRNLDRLLCERSAKYQSVGYITGVSPPDLTIKGDSVYTSFPDAHATPTSKSDYTLQGWVRNIEFFYWTPEMPELVREQCHLLLNVMNANKQFRRFFKQLNPAGQVISWPDYDILRHVRKPYLYPNYPLDNLQVGKPDDVLNKNPWYSWFFNNPHAAEFVDPLTSAVKAQQALIHPRFFVYANEVRQHSIMQTSNIVNYKTFDSKQYYIGKLSIDQ